MNDILAFLRFYSKLFVYVLYIFIYISISIYMCLSMFSCVSAVSILFIRRYLIGWSSMNRHIKYHIGTILGYMWYMWFNMGIAYNHDTLIAHRTQTSYYNWLFNWYLYVKIAGLIFTLLNSFITLKLKFSLNTTFVDLVIFCFYKRSCNMSVFSPFITPFMESVYNILIAYLYNFSI